MPKIKRTTIELEDELAEVYVHGYSDDKQEAARAILRHTLKGDLGDTTKPYCTCATSGGYGFDQQLGIYVHHSTKPGVFCYKPSKMYYETAVKAGIIRP